MPPHTEASIQGEESSCSRLDQGSIPRSIQKGRHPSQAALINKIQDVLEVAGLAKYRWIARFLVTFDYIKAIISNI
jgi:hypothetical protein